VAENSKIEWTDHTFNPWIGCTKVSPGCANCYAEMLMDTRYGRVKWGKGQPRVRTSAANWKPPRKWDRAAAEARNEYEGHKALHGGYAHYDEPRRPRVFSASLSDWLDEEVSLSMFADFLELVHSCQNLDWLLLTKRPQNWKDRVADVVNLELSYREANGKNFALIQWLMDWLNGTAPANVWLGTSVEDQQRAIERIPDLLRIPARVRFLSCEPLLGPVRLTAIIKDGIGRDALRVNDASLGVVERHIDWVICGGESGPGARPMLIEWADDLRRQCEEAGVAFFMKQLGAHVGTTNANAHDWPDHVDFEEVPGTPQFAGARVLLSDKKGGCFEDFPSELQVREFPEVSRS
jgi:protein gp37